MVTKRQELGNFGETRVVKNCVCQKCNHNKTLIRLPNNFKCADVICDFCGYLGQVKAANVLSIEILPKQIIGAAWAPQHERMQAGIYFSLFLVLVQMPIRCFAIYYLPAESQMSSMFKVRKPLSLTAKRKGWVGFNYNLEEVKTAFIRLR